ncbi:hypothetical protein EDB85DRAFT_2276562 [Lactarius pseudohatsudake]|nr:hypothetical protein EDB85DRAFT_2276562 [Lactarius pseudohatsudake]
MLMLQPSQPHACACITDEAAQSHSLETVRAPPAHADLRACAQEPRCALTHGVHEHPLFEQDGLRDAPCVICRLFNDRKGRCGAARAMANPAPQITDCTIFFGQGITANFGQA